MAFPSVYEMIVDPLTTLRKQHFWEYFSGSKLQQFPTYKTDFSTNTGWTTSNSSKVDISTANNELQIKENGGTLAQMYYDLGASVSATKWVIRCRILVNGSANTDEVLFKFELNDTANASSNTNSDSLGFYVYTDRANTWSRIYQVCKNNTTSVQGISATPAYYGNISSGTYYYMTLTRSSATDYKVEIRTGSHTGTLLSTLVQSAIPSGTTGLRYLTAQTYLQGAGQTMDISEIEFYNGVSTPSGRWTTNDITGTNTFAMKDAVDGGFQITTGSGNGDQGSITFNDIRQYSPTGSTIIGVVKFDETTIDGAFGLSNSNSLGSSHSVLWNESTETNFKLSTSGTGARTETDTSVVRDTSTRTVKIVNGSSDVNMYFDNVLVSTISSPNPVPNAAMQPIFYLKTQSAATKTGHITYCEAYNT